MKPKALAFATTTVGAGLLCGGLALIYVPAALVAAGVGLLAFGLLGVEVE